MATPPDYEFQRRLEQYLAALAPMAEGRRDRLRRPLKQADINCWGEAAPDAVDSLKVGMRSIAHEILELYFLQLEGPLAACGSDAERVLLVALVATQLPHGRRVQFEYAGQRTGFEYPGSETLTIRFEPTAPAPRLLLTLEQFERDDFARRNEASLAIRIVGSERVEPGASDDGAAWQLTKAEVMADPYAAATKLVGILHQLLSLNRG